MSSQQTTSTKSNLALYLARVDTSLGLPKSSDRRIPTSKAQPSAETHALYCTFLDQFNELRLDDTVLLHMGVLVRKVLASKMVSLTRKSFRKLTAVCLFLSIKYVVDEYVLFLEDFEKLSGMNRETLAVLETTILVDVMKFEVNFSSEEIKLEERRLAAQA